jgi:hypothetical protein
MQRDRYTDGDGYAEDYNKRLTFAESLLCGLFAVIVIGLLSALVINSALGGGPLLERIQPSEVAK